MTITFISKRDATEQFTIKNVTSLKIENGKYIFKRVVFTEIESELSVQLWNAYCVERN